MVPSTEPERRDPPKQHLHPTRHGERLPQHPMRHDHISAYPPMHTLLEMKPQVNTQHDLRNEHQHQPIRKRGVSVDIELAPAVGVAEEVAHDGEDDAEGLDGDVPAGADHAQDHTRGEDDAEGEDLDEDMDPEDGVDGLGGDSFAFGDLVGVVFVGEGSPC